MTERLEEGYRALGQASIGDVDDGRHEVVVDFPHEVLDDYRTDWGRGCWDESHQRSLPPMVWNHDPSDLIGRAYRSENLGDKTRLITKFSDFDAVPRAKQAFAQIRDGDVPGFSFHYREGRTVAHPNVRGARRFVKARMMEHSPVVFPAIPGAQAVGIRSNLEAPTVEVPTIDEILRLGERGITDEDGMRALIAEHYPTLREHIRVRLPLMTAAERAAWVEKFTTEMTGAGVRDMTIVIDAEGKVTTDDTGFRADDGLTELAQAADQVIIKMGRLFEDAGLVADSDGLRSLPDPVQEAFALIRPAAVCMDELLDGLGAEHIDPDSGERAILSSAQQNGLPDADFAYIESGGTKDASGKTIPRDKRHFPIQDAAHVRNALARIAQGAEFGDKAKSAVMAAAKKFGVDMPDSGKRSEPTEHDDAALDADLARVQDKLARLK